VTFVMAAPGWGRLAVRSWSAKDNRSIREAARYDFEKFDGSRIDRRGRREICDGRRGTRGFAVGWGVENEKKYEQEKGGIGTEGIYWGEAPLEPSPPP